MNDPYQIDWSLTTWQGSRRAQLRQALAMTLRERLEAMEGLAEVARRIQEMNSLSVPVTNSSGSQAPIAHWRASDKQEQPLEAHLDGVSKLARMFAAKIGLQDAGELIGALHDLGKYSKEFQDYLRSAVGLLDLDADDYVDAKGLKGKVDHSTAGAQYIWTKLEGKSPHERITAQVLALCVASHHSGLIDCVGGDANTFGKPVFPRRMSKSHEKTHLDEVLRVADKQLIARCDVSFPAPL